MVTPTLARQSGGKLLLAMLGTAMIFAGCGKDIIVETETDSHARFACNGFASVVNGLGTGKMSRDEARTQLEAAVAQAQAATKGDSNWESLTFNLIYLRDHVSEGSNAGGWRDAAVRAAAMCNRF